MRRDRRKLRNFNFRSQSGQICPIGHLQGDDAAFVVDRTLGARRPEGQDLIFRGFFRGDGDGIFRCIGFFSHRGCHSDRLRRRVITGEVGNLRAGMLHNGVQTHQAGSCGQIQSDCFIFLVDFRIPGLAVVRLDGEGRELCDWVTCLNADRPLLLHIAPKFTIVILRPIVCNSGRFIICHDLICCCIISKTSRQGGMGPAVGGDLHILFRQGFQINPLGQIDGYSVAFLVYDAQGSGQAEGGDVGFVDAMFLRKIDPPLRDIQLRLQLFRGIAACFAACVHQSGEKFLSDRGNIFLTIGQTRGARKCAGNTFQFLKEHIGIDGMVVSRLHLSRVHLDVLIDLIDHRFQPVIDSKKARDQIHRLFNFFVRIGVPVLPQSDAEHRRLPRDAVVGKFSIGEDRVIIIRQRQGPGQRPLARPGRPGGISVDFRRHTEIILFLCVLGALGK